MVREGTPRPGVPKEMPDYHSELITSSISIPRWGFVRKDFPPSPGESKEIPDYDNQIISRSLITSGERQSWLSVATLRATSVMITKARCVVVPPTSSSPGSGLCGRGHLAQGGLKRTSLLPLWSFEEVGSPRAGVC